MTFSICADRSSDEKKAKHTHIKSDICLVSFVMCHMSHIMFPKSMRPTATATDTSYANSPTMHNILVCKHQRTKIIISFFLAILAHFSAKIVNSDTTYL